MTALVTPTTPAQWAARLVMRPPPPAQPAQQALALPRPGSSLRGAWRSNGPAAYSTAMFRSPLRKHPPQVDGRAWGGRGPVGLAVPVLDGERRCGRPSRRGGWG